MTKQIQLTKGKFAIIDDEDYLLVSKYKWNYRQCGRDNTGYATFSGGTRKHRIHIKMHRLIIGAADGEIVDHIDGNGLNNTRSNLRICSQSENMRNRRHTIRHNKTSNYKCVRFHNNKWEAYITTNKKRIHLGTYESEELAALAYNKAAIKYHGEFATFNRVSLSNCPVYSK